LALSSSAARCRITELLKPPEKIGSKYRFHELHARHWGQMAEAAQLGAPQLKRRVLEIAGKLPHLAIGLQT
jgi:serine/threonine-protein kinase HipA